MAMLLSQTPRPSHLNAGVNASVVVSHLDARQTVPTGWRRQSPTPSQVPSFWQVDGSSAAQAGCPVAGGAPTASGEQVPSRPTRLQAWQEVSQGLSQQTPSAQKSPEAQLLAAVQASPILWGAPSPPASPRSAPGASRPSAGPSAPPSGLPPADRIRSAVTACPATSVTSPVVPVAMAAPEASNAVAANTSTPDVTPGT